MIIIIIVITPMCFSIIKSHLYKRTDYLYYYCIYCYDLFIIYKLSSTSLLLFLMHFICKSSYLPSITLIIIISIIIIIFHLHVIIIIIIITIYNFLLELTSLSLFLFRLPTCDV